MEAVVKRFQPVAAVIGGRFTEETLKFKPKQILTGDLRTKAEVKTTLSMIDRELGNYKSLPELDFRAGYVAGRIYEKEAAGLITPGLKDELLSILYTKYQVIRSLESENITRID